MPAGGDVGGLSPPPREVAQVGVETALTAGRGALP